MIKPSVNPIVGMPLITLIKARKNALLGGRVRTIHAIDCTYGIKRLDAFIAISVVKIHMYYQPGRSKVKQRLADKVGRHLPDWELGFRDI